MLCSRHAQCLGPGAGEAVGSPGLGAYFPSSPLAQVDTGPLMVGLPSTAYLGPKAHINSCLIALGDPGGKKRGWCAIRNDERTTLERCLSSAQLRREEVTRMDVGTQPLELFEWKLWRTTLRALNG